MIVALHCKDLGQMSVITLLWNEKCRSGPLLGYCQGLHKEACIDNPHCRRSMLTRIRTWMTAGTGVTIASTTEGKRWTSARSTSSTSFNFATFIRRFCQCRSILGSFQFFGWYNLINFDQL